MDELSRALSTHCIYVKNGNINFGGLTIDEAIGCDAVFTPHGRTTQGQYIVLKSLWHDIRTCPCIVKILEEFPRTEIKLYTGRQAIYFQEGDEVFLKLKYKK